MAKFVLQRKNLGWGVSLAVSAVFLVALLFPLCGYSQSGAGTTGTNDSTPSADSQLTTLTVLHELEAMKERIAVLEAEIHRLKAEQSARAAAPPAAAGGAGEFRSNGIVAVRDSAVSAAASDLAPATSPMANTMAGTVPAPSEGQSFEAATQTKKEPLAFADFSWLTGNSRQKDYPLSTKYFTPEIRVDVAYVEDFNHPQDDTIGGSSEIFRSNEFQLTQLGVGGDLHVDNVRGRLLTQFGMYSQTQPRNDPSPARGQWTLDGAYRYLAEANGGYHFDVLHGVNVDAGIFMSYIGLFSFYNYDNWAYQPSYVSSNTPWFFNGVRVQIFPTEKLKIEPWFINGWQSYGQFNKRPGVGGQILWRPSNSVSIVGNQYAVGRDTLGAPNRTRWHTDDSIQVKYYDKPDNFVDKSAFTITIDAGCESGSGVACFGNGKNGAKKQSFLGFMVYDRVWFHKDLYAFTVGGGAIDNPGRYLVLLPPINGATAFSGTPYFTGNPGDPFKAWDASATFDYMPSQFVTFRWEFNHRASNVPYFSGPGGITPPGGNQGPLGSQVFLPNGALWTPDLRKFENRATIAIMVKF
jgi:uncharacterized small protein (DUF1192 family)